MTNDGDTYSNSKPFTVAPDTYMVNRDNVVNWFVTASPCTPSGSVVTDLTQGSATITVASGAAVTCTFILERGVVIQVRAFHDLVRNNSNLGKRNGGAP